MRILRVAIRLERVASHVEPDRRVERCIRAKKDVGQFVVKSGAVFRRLEVALGQTPIANSLSHTCDQSTHATLAIGRAYCSMQVLAGNDIGSGYRPILWDFDVLLLEDRVDRKSVV